MCTYSLLTDDMLSLSTGVQKRGAKPGREPLCFLTVSTRTSRQKQLCPCLSPGRGTYHFKKVVLSPLVRLCGSLEEQGITGGFAGTDHLKKCWLNRANLAKMKSYVSSYHEHVPMAYSNRHSVPYADQSSMRSNHVQVRSEERQRRAHSGRGGAKYQRMVHLSEAISGLDACDGLLSIGEHLPNTI